MKLSRFTKAAVAVGTALALSTTVISPASATDVDDSVVGSAALGTLGVSFVTAVGLGALSTVISVLFWIGVYNLAVLNHVIPQGTTVKVPIVGFPQ